MRAATLFATLLGSASAQMYCPDNMYSGCRPAGERMYTPYPNAPVMGKEFNLLIVGCNMRTQGGTGTAVERDYMIVPGKKPCGLANPDALPSECKLNVDTLDIQKRIPASCAMTGWLCTNCAKMAHSDGTLMSTSSIEKILYEETSVGEKDYDGQLVPLTVCRQSIAYDQFGNQTVAWTALPAHDREVSQRSDTASLSIKQEVRGAADINAAAGLEPESGGSCCEGLKLGDACLPLIVFILLWLLMAALLGLLAYMCHKNQTDVDAERNNQQFNQFGTDKELQDLAAQQEDEDDI